jgi:hypothetical protein
MCRNMDKIYIPSYIVRKIVSAAVPNTVAEEVIRVMRHWAQRKPFTQKPPRTFTIHKVRGRLRGGSGSPGWKAAGHLIEACAIAQLQANGHHWIRHTKHLTTYERMVCEIDGTYTSSDGRVLPVEVKASTMGDLTAETRFQMTCQMMAQNVQFGYVVFGNMWFTDWQGLFEGRRSMILYADRSPVYIDRSYSRVVFQLKNGTSSAKDMLRARGRRGSYVRFTEFKAEDVNIIVNPRKSDLNRNGDYLCAFVKDPTCEWVLLNTRIKDSIHRVVREGSWFVNMVDQADSDSRAYG